MTTEIFYQEIIELKGKYNCERPEYFADLLEKAAKRCRELHTSHKRTDGLQPFLIEDVIVDPYEGQVVLYYIKNNIRDISK